MNKMQDWEKPLWEQWGVTATTKSGEIITKDNALRVSAIYAAIDIKAKAVAKLPLQVFKREDGKRVRVKEHPVSYLVEGRPNIMQSNYTFKHTLQVHRHTHGAAFVFPSLDPKTGKPTSLTLLDPTTMSIYQDPQTGSYWFMQSGKEVKAYHPSEIAYLPYFTPDGINALSPIQVARETAGQMKAAQNFMSGFYAQGAATNIVMHTNQELDKDAKTRIREEWANANTGTSNAGKLAVISHGMTIDNITMPIADMEFINTMKFNIGEIARIFSVPPHLLAELERSTNNNIEHQARDFVSNSIQPDLTSIEEEFNYKFFTEIERGQYYVKFNLSAALRANDETRSIYYDRLMKLGVLSINDVLELEDMDGIEGGERPRVDLNSIALDLADQYQLSKAGGTSKGGE